MKKISVIGIGRLGLCFSLSLEKSGYDVTGVDINQDYVNKINDKCLKSDEHNVENYLNNCTNFIATTSLKDALHFSDILFTVVATPSLNNGRYDHSQIDSLVENLISFGKQKNTKNLKN